MGRPYVGSPQGTIRGTMNDLRQAHGIGLEDAAVHELQVIGDERAEFHLAQDVPFKVDARGDFCQHESLRRQAEDGPFCNDQDVLAVGCGVVPGKGDLFDIRLEFLVLPFPVDDQPPAFTVFSQTAGCKGPHEDEFLRVLGQVDEAPGPGDAAVEF